MQIVWQDWDEASQRPRPAFGVVDLYEVKFSQKLRRDELLSDDERDRVTRYVMERSREQFAIARSCLRIILSGYVGRSPQSLQFTIASGGKPLLRNDDLHFNLSHSGDVALIAVSGQRVGVDVEIARPIPNVASLVQRFFSREEALQFESLREELRLTAFFHGWTAKEALLKAVGVGLTDLESCIVDLDPGLSGRVIRFDHAGEWSLKTMTLARGEIASVVMDVS